MKNFTQELKDILKEDPGAPILSPDEVRSRANTMVILTNEAPKELLAIAGSSRKAILVNYNPLMITFPDQKGVYKVQPDDIVFENHHSGRDVTEAGSQETSYEKFFAAAMKKFNVSSPIELSPDETKKFFNYVDKNWKADEESDGSKTEILPALARGAMAVGNVAGALGDENEGGCGGGWEDPPRLGGEPSLITPMEGDDNEDVSTGKVGKKDKGSYQHAYKLALKKYKIHSADELDTPAERKGFTAYVDRLWKGGEVKDHALPEVSREEKARRKVAIGKETKKRDKAQADRLKKRVAGSDKTTAEKSRERDAADRERRQADIKKKAAEQKAKRMADKDRENKAADKYREDLERKRQEKERQRSKDNSKKKPQPQKRKGMGLGGVLSKASGAAKGALSKYKSTGG